MLSNKFLRLASGISLLALSNSIYALEITCPESIAPSESVSAPTQGWKVFTSDDIHYFQNVSVYEGHPKERASLIPRDDKKAGKAISRWTLPREKQYKYWLRCDYLNTNASYIIALPDTATACIVTYRMLDKKTTAGIERIYCE